MKNNLSVVIYYFRGNGIDGRRGMALGAVHASACAHHLIGPVTGTDSHPCNFVFYILDFCLL